MLLDKDIAWLFISVGLLAIAPLLAKLSHRVSKYLLDTYVADDILIVTYLTNGKVDSRITIKTKSNGSIVRKMVKGSASDK